MAIQSLYPSIAPSLSLDFANVKALDPRITFARASGATFYDGVTVAKAEENLLLRSQEFNDAVWSLNAATVITNNTTAPDGTSTADTLVESATTATHGINGTITAISGAVYTFSVFAKRNGRDLQLIYGFNDVTGNPYANFDLSAGTVATTSGSITATIASVGNGWYRCSITATAAVSANFNPFVALINSTAATYAPSYTGDNTSGVFLWGAQLEQRSSVTAYTPTTTQPITNYIPVLQTAPANTARFDHNPVTGESLGLLVEEQRTNLLTYSEDFANAVWAKARASITSNTIVAPDGTLTGDKLVEDTTASNTHVVYAPNYSATNTTITATVYAKAGERSQFFLEVSNFITGFGGAVFNLATGATTNLTNAGDYTNTSASITPVGNGWYRCSITTTKGSLNSVNRWVIELYNGSTTQYTGDGYSGIYIWGAQLEAGAFPTSYIKTEASQVTRSADAASMTGANFSSWFSNAEGTIYAESQLTGNAVNKELVAISDDTTNNFMALRWASGGQAQLNVTANGSNQVNIAPSGYSSLNVFYKRSYAYKTDDVAQVINGVIVGSDTSAVIPAVNKIYIGASGSGIIAFAGTIRKLAFYPQRLSNANLQALTS